MQVAQEKNHQLQESLLDKSPDEQQFSLHRQSTAATFTTSQAHSRITIQAPKETKVLKEFQYDSKVITICFNKEQNQIYIVTLEEVILASFPQMDKIKSKKGNFAEWYFIKVNDSEDTMIWQDKSGLNVAKIDNFFNTEKDTEILFNTKKYILAADFASNEEIIISPFFKHKTVYQKLKQVRDEVKAGFSAENMKLSFQKKAESYRVCEDEGQTIEFPKTKDTPADESELVNDDLLPNILHLGIHQHPFKKADNSQFWKCNGSNFFPECLSEAHSSNFQSLQKWQCDICQISVCQYCARGAQPPILNTKIRSSSNRTYTLIQDPINNQLMTIDHTDMHIISKQNIALDSYCMQINTITTFHRADHSISIYHINYESQEFNQFNSKQIKLEDDNVELIKISGQKLYLRCSPQKTIIIVDLLTLKVQQTTKEDAIVGKFYPVNDAGIFLLSQDGVIKLFTFFLKTIKNDYLYQYAQRSINSVDQYSYNRHKIMDLDKHKTHYLEQDKYILKQLFHFPQVPEVLLGLYFSVEDEMCQVLGLLSTDDLSRPKNVFTNHKFSGIEFNIQYGGSHKLTEEFYILEQTSIKFKLYSAKFENFKELVVQQILETKQDLSLVFQVAPDNKSIVFTSQPKLFRLDLNDQQKDLREISVRPIATDFVKIVNKRITVNGSDPDQQGQTLFYLGDNGHSIYIMDYESENSEMLMILPKKFTFDIINNESILIKYLDKDSGIEIINIDDRQRKIKLNVSFDSCQFYDNSLYFRTRDQMQFFKVSIISNNRDSYFGLMDYFEMIPTCTEMVVKENKQKVEFYDQDKNRISSVNLALDSFQYRNVEQILKKNDQDVVQTLQRGIPPEFLKEFPSSIGSLMHKIALRPLIIEEFMRQLQFYEKTEVPFLFQKNSHDVSPLDIAVKNNSTKCIDLMIEMMDRYYDNPNFNFMIDEHICTFIQKSIDLDEYFDSTLPIFQIIRKEFPNLHVDDKELIKPANYNSIQEITENYDEILGQYLNDKKDEQVSPIEYFVINCPVTLTQNPKQIMKSLQETDRIEIYENLTIQTIINFKWNQYTKNFFEKQFLIFLVFVILFIVDLYMSIYMDDNNIHILDGFDNGYVITDLIIKLICIGILSYFAKYEIKSAMTNFKDYISEYWNFIDFSVILLQVVVTLLFVTGVDFNLTRILYCLLCIMIFVKVCFFLRIYDGFSFLVSMMQGVFLDLKYFIAFYMFVLILFTMLFSILNVKLGAAYEPIGNLGYFMMSFRTSTGDFEVDDYAEMVSPIVYISWIVWLIAVLILNIVFMNFIIAVISESYEKIMQKLVSQIYSGKVDLIVERELHFSEDDEKNPYYFPRYIMLRRPVRTDGGNMEEWQGFIKDLKGTVKNNTQRIINQIQNSQEKNFRSSIETMNMMREIELSANNTNQRVINLEKKLDLLLQKIK